MRLTIGILLAVLFSPLAQAELIDEINDRGELRIAVLGDAPPYAFKENEHLTGFEIELGQALAKELDVRAEFVETAAEEVLPGVESGKYDMTFNKQDIELSDKLDAIRTLASQKLVIPYQKGNPAFETAVNNALQRIEDDGRLAALEKKWLTAARETSAGQ
ncbi:ABC transporter substrate-binding protein [Pseudomonas sp. 250J]|uniref:Transporter substrate-binding domain-containing protein n=1 Tax=Pseudomonas peradeniyensis TaxID=2745488 RepID=A0ABT2V734_9PSED|nr:MULTISPECIES: transporter substrate-binding domain-containing protein [Pseudomonas]KNX75861.1 ABC transporter substrate-binding protein [Pseudomonas sp. 250J]MCU7237506.1 transporter substrate-binding domain-containing protein [Pseudomonas peradeniyensis]MCU7279159.1 transporter substrate-binding domain-containing protein [Pseudomonas peradeniyensis]QZA54239.1 transporter substrate-binding domain-containing protein [Pseudomonas sp. 2hn]